MVLICGDGLSFLDLIAARWRTGRGDSVALHTESLSGRSWYLNYQADRFKALSHVHLNEKCIFQGPLAQWSWKYRGLCRFWSHQFIKKCQTMKERLLPILTFFNIKYFLLSCVWTINKYNFPSSQFFINLSPNESKKLSEWVKLWKPFSALY